MCTSSARQNRQMLKTIFSFIFALIIVALISLGVTIFSMGGFQGLESSFAWETFVVFIYGTVHKLGIVALVLAFIFHLLPTRLPRLLILVAISAPLAMIYNYILLATMDNGQMLSQLQARGLTTLQIINEVLIYYGIFGALLALIGGVLSLRLTRKN